MILPRNDRVLVERMPEPQIGLIIAPDIAKEKSITGIVRAVGPGKWIPGEWWKTKKPKLYSLDEGKTWEDSDGWEWFPGHREEHIIKVGQVVSFNSKWNDFASDYYDDLPIGTEPNLHLIQIADIFGIVNV